MNILPETLRQILLNSGFISANDFDQASKGAKDLGKTIEDILLFRGLISENILGQLIAEYLQVPYCNLGNKVIPLEILDLVPENLAQTYHMVPFNKEGKNLHLAMEDPKNLEAQEVVRRRTNLNIIPYYVTNPNFTRGISQYKRNISKEFEKIIAENLKKTKEVDQKKGLSEVASELPVVEILNTILEYGVAEKASDVHLEIMEKELMVRLRIDGVLRDIISLPQNVQPAIIARIKILSNLKIDEHRIPQDGRFRFTLGVETVALRTSILPGFYGENAVLRLLFESSRPLSLEELGLSGKNLQWVKKEIKKPHGMILVTGPTGSGKTSTLYSILNMLNRVEVKICTIEDPVEYDMHRITQIQVNPKTGLTFSSGLRSLLRHDPDIMMVGEIRDKETAQISIHAALTGHLVLSTLHTNDASGAIPRFIDMGVEPFLLASTVNLVIAQRLVRRLCQNCIEEYIPDSARTTFLQKIFGSEVNQQKFYQGKGCSECAGNGYKGRIGVFEVLPITEKIRKLVVQKSSSDAIKSQAQQEGFTLILKDGLNKVASGLTSVEEILRVAEE